MKATKAISTRVTVTLSYTHTRMKINNWIGGFILVLTVEPAARSRQMRARNFSNFLVLNLNTCRDRKLCQVFTLLKRWSIPQGCIEYTRLFMEYIWRLLHVSIKAWIQDMSSF